MERSTAIRIRHAVIAAIAIAAVAGFMAWLARVGNIAAPAVSASPDQHPDAAAPASGIPDAGPAPTPPDATRTLATAAPADASAPRAALRVHAIDEQDAPVAGATIWLAASRMHLGELHADATLPRQVTDSTGNATFGDLAPAQYRIHVEHETLVFSHQLQDQTHLLASIAPRVPEVAATTIRLAMPDVAALRVDGAEFHC